MKKISLVLALAIFSFIGLQAQGNVQFGATGGFINGSGKIDFSVIGFNVGGIDVVNGAGFYVGLLADIEATEKLHVQPEALYASIDGESVIIVPIMAKYYVSEKLNIQAGPQVDFVLDVPSIVKEVVNTAGFSLAFGAGYDISDQFAVQAKYSVGLSNRIDGDLTSIASEIADADLKIDTFQIGVVYMFN